MERGIIIMLASEKGGAGKSTLAMNIATELCRLGYRALLVDADPQKTSSKWAQRRDDSIDEGKNWPRVYCTEKTGKIRNMLLEYAKDYDAVVVDPAGRDSQELRSGLAAADVVYVPTQVSQADLETMGDLIRILDETEELNPDRNVKAIITQAPLYINAQENKEAKDFMAAYSEYLPLSNCVIHARKSYRVAPRSGMSVIEANDRKAAAEIQLLVKEILKNA